jgi:hypothetical protein
MSYTDPDLERLSFRGVGVFKKGKLQQGPFTFIRGDGYGRSFTRMINRDAIPGTENYNLTYFLPKNSKRTDSWGDETDISGLQYYSGQFNEYGFWDGKGKRWENNGNFYIGQYKDNKRSEGKFCVLEDNCTYTVYQVKYVNGKLVDKKEL